MVIQHTNDNTGDNGTDDNTNVHNKSGGTDDSNCPDIGGAAPHSWVGADYLCATGNPSTTTNERIWYDTPLFSSDWWQVGLTASTTEDLEVRLIGTSNTADEDMGVELLQLFIR